MELNESLVLNVAIQLISAGVFIGIVKSSLAQIFNRLEKMETKQEAENAQNANLRERVAVLESKLSN